jgi:predicted transcriptional regulator
MARKKSSSLTDGEHRIMEVLWEKGSATVAEVAEALQGKDGSAYTTVLTMLRIMHTKGYLNCRKDGRAHVYTPKVKRETAARKAVRQLLQKFFAGSPGELVLAFLREEDLSPAELDALKNRILTEDPSQDPSISSQPPQTKS